MQPVFYTPIRKARAVLLWTLLCFAVGNMVFGRLVHRRHPELFNPAIDLRLAHLHKVHKQAGERPLMVLVGSSRPANAISPAAVMESGQPASGPGPVLFNFAVLGNGPVWQLMNYRRLRAEGIRPHTLFVEAWAPFLTQRGAYEEQPTSTIPDVYWCDLAVMSGFYHQRWLPLEQAVLSTLVPLVQHRTELMRRYASVLVANPEKTAEEHFASLAWLTLQGDGWLPLFFGRQSPQRTQEMMDFGKSSLQPAFADFRVSPITDQAYRTLLQECHGDGVRVVLCILPEHSSLRGWYPPAARQTFATYLKQLSQEFAVPVVDTRTWSPDEDFYDMCHLLREAARRYSERFGREIYRPLAEGRPLPASVLLHADTP